MMTQKKISAFFRKGPREADEDCDDLEQEVLKLEKTMKEKRDQFFQLQRNKHKCNRAPPKRETEILEEPQRIMKTNDINSIKQKRELITMLLGIEIQSYVPEEHCAVVYHMQHGSEVDIKHGVLIKMKNGANEVSTSSLPLGFNLAAVLSNFDNVLERECILSIRRGLVAYYDRLGQCDQLKKILSQDIHLFNSLDGSHIQITLAVQNENQPDQETYKATLMFDYRVYDIRPSQLALKETDLPEEIENILTLQCAVFKKKPLHDAFKSAFLDGNGALVTTSQGNIDTQAVQRSKRKTKPFRPPNPHYNNDDTFHPEDCSESDDDDVGDS